MRTKFKPWGLPYLIDHPEVAKNEFDSTDNFYSKNMELEIGGGKGDFIIGLSKLNPNKNYLMIERVTSVLCVACKKIVEEEIKNVRLIYNEFSKVAPSIPDGYFSKIYLNFSDPWPKKRHSKRRLTSKGFLDSYYRVLNKEGLIIIKTDQLPLYEFSKKSIDEKQFKIIYDNPNYIELDKGDIMTEYESKFRSENKTIYRLILKKVWKN